MSTPDHDEIALHAWKLWQSRGCPDNCAEEIWLEAEQDLRAGPATEMFTAYANTNTVLESVGEYHLSPAQTEQQSLQAEMRKEAARAPQVPHHTGPKPLPATTGKPLWSVPHSS